MQELTISASAFKARCLDLMDQVASHKLSYIVITKRGKPVSVLRAPETAQPARSIIGCIAGKVPALTDAEWGEVELEMAEAQKLWPNLDTMEASFVEQLEKDN